MDVNTFLSHRRSLATPSGEIACTEFGAGPTALFVHGLGTSGALWRQVIEDLSDTSRCIAADIEAGGGQLCTLNVPTLLVWGTADTMFPVKWAYHLRDLIPGAREVIEIDGAKLFFPEERPEDLVPHLRRLWDR